MSAKRDGEKMVLTGALILFGLWGTTNVSAQTTATIPAPVLVLSVNEAAGGSSFNGWPLVIQVDLYNPNFTTNDAPVTPIPLSTSSGSWADAVSITVTDSTGAQVQWPLHQVLRPTGADAAIALDAETSGHLAWWVAPVDTTGLPAGTFQISALLDSTTATDPTVFQGQSYSSAVTLTLGAEPSVLLPPQFESKYLMATFYDVLAGNNAQAMTDVNTLLGAQPQNLRGLVAKGELLEASGDATNALASYDSAVTAFYAATPNPPEPPVELLERSASLRGAAISKAAAIAAPQIGVQLQNFTQTSAGIYSLDLQVTNSGAGVGTNFAVSQITFATVSGSGQVSLDTSVPSQLPGSVASLAPGATGTVHFSLAVPAGVSTFTASEIATVQNTIGSSSSVSGSQTVYVVTTGPAITSGDTASFQVGAAGSFAVTATGAPPPAISESGALPSGVSFTDLGSGAGTLRGTPAAGSGGVYGLSLQASNGIGTEVTQGFTLTVNEGAAITSPRAVTFSVGSAGSFGVKATGYPAPTLSESGMLPGGVAFDAGTGVLSGTPGTGTGGVYTVAFSAANTLATATQTFTLTINEPPQFTSASSTTFAAGSANTFTIACAGFPVATFSESGALPAGVTLVSNGNGTATLAGTPTAAGTFQLALICSNGSGANAAQNFTLAVAGQGGEASLNVSPTSIDFGKVRSGHRVSKDITLTNNGSLPVEIDRLYLTIGPRTDREEFAFTRACGLHLNVSNSCTVRVVFEADDLGAASAVLHVVDSAAGSPQTVTLSGTSVR